MKKSVLPAAVALILNFLLLPLSRGIAVPFEGLVFGLDLLLSVGIIVISWLVYLDFRRFHWLIFCGALYTLTLLFLLVFPSDRGYPAWLPSVLRTGWLAALLAVHFPREKKLLRRFTQTPARSILLLFVLAIVIGAWLLMLPVSTLDGRGLALIDAFFTSTSAVCVTGLIVVDTATVFTLFGRLVVLLLIQAGGLGIMILSFFSIFVFRRRLRMENKLLLSFAISRDDLSDLTGAVRWIFIITFGLEGAGTLALFACWAPVFGVSFETLFLALFHAVSAFCNAGFSLFSDSLIRFQGHWGVNLTVMTLIITGGLGFAVIMNLGTNLKARIQSGLSLTPATPGKISLNTKVVLTGTALLLASAFFLYYALEHRNTLAGKPLDEQYLAAVFQSVTLRTAGFNSVDFSRLKEATLFLMLVYMLIGAGSGGTAGGIKINTVAALLAFIRGYIRGDRRTVLAGYSISDKQIHHAFLVLFSAVVLVFAGSFALVLFEDAALKDILFEVCSAIGTVGLSTGLTGSLSIGGKIVLIFLMYIGRLGPLTILGAGRIEKHSENFRYPVGEIAVG